MCISFVGKSFSGLKNLRNMEHRIREDNALIMASLEAKEGYVKCGTLAPEEQVWLGYDSFCEQTYPDCYPWNL